MERAGGFEKIYPVDIETLKKQGEGGPDQKMRYQSWNIRNKIYDEILLTVNNSEHEKA